MLIELRVLLGPNADIPAPAIRVTLAGPTEPGLDLCEVTDRIARAADAYVGPAVSRTGRGRDRRGGLPLAARGDRRGDRQRPGRGPADRPRGAPRRADRHSRRRASAVPIRATRPACSIRPCPTVAVTGTNGKTTTTRLLGRMAAEAGLLAAWSSTDGVFVAGRCIEPGDWSGPGGARHGARGARGGVRRPGDGARRPDAARDGRVAPWTWRCSPTSARTTSGCRGSTPSSMLAWAKSTVVRGRAPRRLGGPQRRGPAGAPVPRRRAGQPVVLRPRPRGTGCALAARWARR